MNAILNIGHVLRTDEEGYLVNESGAGRIASPWDRVVEAVRDAYLKNLGERVHSIYIRGSVARGHAIEGISDVDSFAVIRGMHEPPDFSWVPRLNRELKTHSPFCNGVEVVCLPYEELLDQNEEELTSWRMILKTQSVCIYGEDLSDSLPRFKPGPGTFTHAADLRKDIQKFSDGLRAIRIAKKFPYGGRLLKRFGIDPEQLPMSGCQWVMKRIVRTGFEIVMEEERAYTRDLYPCYELFSKHYPAKSEQMRRALELTINPSSDPSEILAFLDDFGAWLVGRTEQKLGLPESRKGASARLAFVLNSVVRKNSEKKKS